MTIAPAVEPKWLTSTQIGAVGEAVVAAGLILASKGRFAPFKPFADDGGIDLLIFDKAGQGVLPLQLKCRTGADRAANGTVEFDVRLSAFKEDLGIFVLAALLTGCAIQTAWLVPPSEFRDLAQPKPGKLVMVASPKPEADDKWRRFRHGNFDSLVQEIGRHLAEKSATRTSLPPPVSAGA